MIAIFVITFISLSIFWQFFILGILPFPTDFLLAWFEPWKSDFISHSTITIAHKPIADDVFRQLYPFKVLALELFKRGELPLWNPYNGAGMPLLATMHVGLLNPFNIFFIAPFPIAWTLQVVVQPLLIGLTTYLYTKKIGLSRISSLFTTIIFMLSGFVVVRTIFADYNFAVACLPLLLYLVESYLENPSTKKVLFLPLVIFFLFTVTQLQIISYVLFFTFFYFIFRYQQTRTKIYFQEILTILIYSLLGIGLSLIQIIPSAELFLGANVTTESSKFIFDRFLLPTSHLLTIPIPNYFGNQSTYNYWGAGDYIETVAYVGLIPLFFAFLSLNKKMYKDITLFYLLTVLTTIALTIDWFGSRFLYSLPIPILSTGIPSRIFFLTTFALCVLAGIGFEKWVRAKTISKIHIYRFLLFLILPLVTCIVTYLLYLKHVSCTNEFIPQCRLIALRNTILELGVLGIGIIFIFLRVVKRFQNAVPILLMVVVSVIGLYNSNKYLPFTKELSLIPENELISAIRKFSTDGRIFTIGDAHIKTNFATHFRYFDPNYYDPLYIKRYGELISYANTNNPYSILRSDVEITQDLNITKEKSEKRNKLLSILGVKYLLYKKSQAPITKLNQKNIVWENKTWYLAKNESALPRAYLVNSVEVISDDTKLLHRLFEESFSSSNSVILEHSIADFEKRNPNEYSARIKLYSENYVQIITNSPSDTLLVLSDNYYPGWKAYIDDKESQIYRANYTFRAIKVPKGAHEVLFTYKPKSIELGAFLSLTSFCVYLLLVFPKIRSNKYQS